MRALAGVALVAAHLVGFVALAARVGGDELTVTVRGPRASAVLTLDGTVPAALAARVTSSLEGTAPGLLRRRWETRYRGGHVRAVGATQLVGPFQDPASRACTGRVVVGQRLLDDGHAGPGTVAHETQTELHAQLAGSSFVGVGDYLRVDALALRWAELRAHPEDRESLGAAPHGYVRVTATVVFERVTVRLVVALAPAPAAHALDVRVGSRAELVFESSVVQWLSDRLGGDDLASWLTRRELDGALVSTLAPPPPFDLGDGQVLGFDMCDGDPEIVDGVSGALPFRVLFAGLPGEPAMRPPRHGAAPHLPLAPGGTLALDLDLDALNDLTHELWRSGYLDRRLAELGLERRFNADPLVAELLSIRLAPARLALPPILSAAPGGLRLASEARLPILDGATFTIGRAWGALDLAFTDAGVANPAVSLGTVELACERSPTVLVPCYADLVAAVRERGGDFHGELSRSFTGLLAAIFVDRRLGAAGMPADLVIRAAAPRITSTGSNASLHLELDARVERAP